ncbi:Subtilisin-like protease [Apostasia shenzhenica]|uniref:Subtilisin-like protease n=1 Tax=Apostasia shenzhenica TaxID=1088818 RepID=A0A2I0BGU8_9ASPA|nr:Subtilisin-like protease [Apostasia shenzhenica]
MNNVHTDSISLGFSEDHPAVISVFPNGLKQLHTTRTWGLLGLEGNSGQVSPASLWKKASYGKDVIIAHLDTGVWPESASFSDDGMGPIPSRWRGSCQNSKKSGVFCNRSSLPFLILGLKPKSSAFSESLMAFSRRKLIGAKYFDKGYKSMEHLPSNASLGTARDTEGHGTHTLSTAGGRFVGGASLFGYANGTAKGGSPEARVATYKVCWEEGCSDADILAGFDEAIHDGVDVLSVSLGGHAQDFASDSIALGAFHAAVNGISVACSAGNEGPYDGSVANTAPWVTTVAASTVDRGFFSTLTLSNNKTFVGYSMAYKGMPANKSYPLINSFAAKAANASNHEG